jgi:hypothetical protein
MAEEVGTEFGGQLTAALLEEGRAGGAAVRAVMGEQFGGQRGVELGPGLVEEVGYGLGREAQQGGDLRGGEAVAFGEVEEFPAQRVDGGDRSPGDHAPVDVVLVVAGDRDVRAAAEDGQPASAFHPGHGIDPRREVLGVAQFADVRLGDDEGVAEGHLGRVAAAEPEPAICVEPLGISVIKVAEGSEIS